MSVETKLHRPTLVISANSSWNIVNFRSGLIRTLIARGHRVVVLAPIDSHSPKIVAMGADFRPIGLRSSGLSVIEDGRSMLDYYRQLRALRPAVFLGFTAKPNIYGSLAAHAVGMPVINNISGLGAAFMRRGLLQGLVSLLYRAALSRSATIFFQNRDDARLFVDRGLARVRQAAMLPGSGVDVERFAPSKDPRPSGAFRFLMVSRMLWDKGVGEFVEAARMLKVEGHEADFALLGHAGVDNRGAIPIGQLQRWDNAGVVRYLGASDDVRPHLALADCVVLPSYYREGVPRSLIEAAAMGRPLITTNEVGCREAVDDGRSGFLCPARSAGALADAMRRMLDLTPEARAAMGLAGRKKAVREYDEKLVGEAYAAALDRLAAPARSDPVSPTKKARFSSMFMQSIFRRQPRESPMIPRGYRVYAVGDIHGRLDLLDRLLPRIEADHRARKPAKAIVVFLGDLIDRGPDSAGVVERLRCWSPDGMTPMFLLGNHEEVLLRLLNGERGLIESWLKFGGTECLKSYGGDPLAVRAMGEKRGLEEIAKAIPPGHREFLGSFADTLRIGDYLFVHAGIRPGVDLSLQSQSDLRWIRSPFLTDEADHGFVVVHGHTIADNVVELPNRIGIDTGAYRSGILTALAIEGGNRWYLDTTTHSEAATAHVDLIGTDR